MENLVVVETDDAATADRKLKAERTGQVKQLEADGSPEGKAHRKIYRPGATTQASWR